MTMNVLEAIDKDYTERLTEYQVVGMNVTILSGSLPPILFPYMKFDNIPKIRLELTVIDNVPQVNLNWEGGHLIGCDSPQICNFLFLLDFMNKLGALIVDNIENKRKNPVMSAFNELRNSL